MSKRAASPRRPADGAILGQKAFLAISAVEGLTLTEAGRKRVLSDKPLEQRRAEVLKAYKVSKGSR